MSAIYSLANSAPLNQDIPFIDQWVGRYSAWTFYRDRYWDGFVTVGYRPSIGSTRCLESDC